MTSTALPWDFFFFKLTEPLTVSRARLLYTVKEKGGKPGKKPCPLPYVLRNPYWNPKSENSQDYAQKSQINCTFMNSASDWTILSLFVLLILAASALESKTFRRSGLLLETIYLPKHDFLSLTADTFTLHLKILSSQKRGGQDGYQSIHLDFVYNRRCFLDTLKGLLFWFKFEKNIFSVKGQKNVVSICTWRALPKTQKRVVTLRDSPVGDTSNAATVAVTKRDVSLLMEKI